MSINKYLKICGNHSDIVISVYNSIVMQVIFVTLCSRDIDKNYRRATVCVREMDRDSRTDRVVPLFQILHYERTGGVSYVYYLNVVKQYRPPC